jgi:hypothetical protein
MQFSPLIYYLVFHRSKYSLVGTFLNAFIPCSSRMFQVPTQENGKQKNSELNDSNVSPNLIRSELSIRFILSEHINLSDLC